jgi:hypothetical protein
MPPQNTQGTQPAPTPSSPQIPPEMAKHLEPARLERYAFLWSEARLLIAAVALSLGGVPPVIKFLPFLSSITYPLLNLAWIISGVVSGYLLFRFLKAGKKVFGGEDMKDKVAFFVNVISGFNLGLAGLIKQNIGMSISSNHVVFVVVGLLYLASAYHLWNRWKAHEERLF